MRGLTTGDKVRRLMRALGRAARGPGRIYLVGGTSAVLVGWRESTHDADLKLDPEPPGVLAALPRLKEELDMNVELAAPDQFVPVPPGWQERSVWADRCGPVEFLHYDFYGQALAKIERGHAQDLADVRAMFARGLVVPERLAELYARAEPDLIRYPAIDPPTLRAKLDEALEEAGDV